VSVLAQHRFSLGVFRQIGSQTRLYLKQPSWFYLRLTLVAAGAVTATIPTGVEGEARGPGVLGGASWGVIGGLVALPLVAAMWCAAAITESEQTGLAQTQLLAGIGRRRQILSVASSTTLLTIAAIIFALIGGAVVGLGDAVRQHGHLVGGIQRPPPLLLIGAATVYLIALGAAAAAATRQRVWCFAALTTSFLVFLSVVAATRRTGGWTWLARGMPWAPLWASLHRSKDLYWLAISPVQSAYVSSAWVLLALSTIALSTRSGRGTRTRCTWAMRKN
jgi:hypothetical protein